MKDVANVFFLGRHANRTPLSYPVYQHALRDYIRVTDNIERANIVVLGYRGDIFEHKALALKLAGPLRRQCKVLVFSEEPLWDIAKTSDFDAYTYSLRVGDRPIDITQINHVTTGFFQFDTIPYYLTTDDRFLLRYRALLQKNTERTAADILDQWSKAEYQSAFLAQRRTRQEYTRTEPEYEMYCLAEYRTRIAEGCRGDSCFVEGFGWSKQSARQQIIDWHTNKLATLDSQCFCISAIENVHYNNHITEKFFDAICCGGIPIYSAANTHRIFEFADPSSWINVWGLSASDAVAVIRSFRPNKALARHYLDTVSHLTDRFTQHALQHERDLLATRAADILQTSRIA